ncbi:HPr family phosphocarrier protein [Rossellomorea marisflavi]|uniref:HPr family phosphocarrier protein n=1 Tax=Rossellomorea marisflavi TaxID=189381 RepID=UPI00296FE8C6|nr:HPr family phosphocarrier protein [Rossellomorea marisflavi]MDW4525405.1 HPr family phosphocarrier protein [Rossellomorea marisflavi]
MQKVRVCLKRGLSATNTSHFVQKARSFSSHVTLYKEGCCANGKDLMEVLDLDVRCDDHVMVMTDGEDEEASIGALKALISGKSDL